jgi:hypothetical protein
MSKRAPLLGLAAAALLLCGCGEEKVAVYRVPKEKDPELPAAAPDAGGPAPGGAVDAAAVPTASGRDLAWEAPAGWTPGPASAMRKASYSIAGSAGDAELSVTAFPGDVGGELANVNRWRGQVGMSPLSEGELDAAVSRTESAGLRVTVVELFPAGTPGAKSILGAIVPFGGSTWFFKVSGPGATVREAKGAFASFIRTIHAP